jgi:hypothetical protein
MARDTVWTAAAARLISLPFRLRRTSPFTPPQRVLILKPCCLSQVLLTTRMLAALQLPFRRPASTGPSATGRDRLSPATRACES